MARHLRGDRHAAARGADRGVGQRLVGRRPARRECVAGDLQDVAAVVGDHRDQPPEVGVQDLAQLLRTDRPALDSRSAGAVNPEMSEKRTAASIRSTCRSLREV